MVRWFNLKTWKIRNLWMPSRFSSFTIPHQHRTTGTIFARLKKQYYTHACIFFKYVNCNWCFWLRAHVMCSRGMVPKPPGEPVSKPFYNIILFPSFLIFSGLPAILLEGQIVQKNQSNNKIAKKEPRGGDWRRERGCSQPCLFLHSIIGSH